MNEWPEANDDEPADLSAKLKTLRFTLHNNNALFALKAQRNTDAERWAGFAVDAAPDDAKDTDKAKAYFRRAQARVRLNDKEGAQQDFNQAARLAPKDAGIAAERTALNTRIAADMKKEKAKYKNAFEFE